MALLLPTCRTIWHMPKTSMNMKPDRYQTKHSLCLLQKLSTTRGHSLVQGCGTIYHRTSALHNLSTFSNINTKAYRLPNFLYFYINFYVAKEICLYLLVCAYTLKCLLACTIYMYHILVTMLYIWAPL